MACIKIQRKKLWRGWCNDCLWQSPRERIWRWVQSILNQSVHFLPSSHNQLPRNEMHCRMQMAAYSSQWAKTTAKNIKFPNKTTSKDHSTLTFAESKSSTTVEPRLSRLSSLVTFFWWILFSHVLRSAANLFSFKVCDKTPMPTKFVLLPNKNL